MGRVLQRVRLGGRLGYVWEVLFEAYDSYDECDGVDVFVGKFEGVVVCVVGDDEYVVLVAAGLDALNDCSLRGVEDVGFVPLEKEAGHGDALAGDDVAGDVCWCHGVAFDGHKEVGSAEGGDDVMLAFVFECGLLAFECSGHCAEWDEGDALLGGMGWMGDVGTGTFFGFSLHGCILFRTFVAVERLLVSGVIAGDVGRGNIWF